MILNDFLHVCNISFLPEQYTCWARKLGEAHAAALVNDGNLPQEIQDGIQRARQVARAYRPPELTRHDVYMYNSYVEHSVLKVLKRGEALVDKNKDLLANVYRAIVEKRSASSKESIEALQGSLVKDGDCSICLASITPRRAECNRCFKQVCTEFLKLRRGFFLK